MGYVFCISGYVQGLPYNHERVYRIYCEPELNLRIKPQRRLKRDKPDSTAVPREKNTVGSIDSMHDRRGDGRAFRTFNVLDDYNRERQGIEVDLAQPSARIIRALDRIIEQLGQPKIIRADNGPENISGEFRTWATNRGVVLLSTRLGKPQQNAYVECISRIVRHEWLDEHLSESIEHAQSTATAWLWRYNAERPDIALRGIAPYQKLANAA